MEFSTLFLSRLQFALTIGFHFLFPPLSIGLAWLLVIIEWRGWKRDDALYTQAGKFFGKILGLTFAVGVATGIVMEFQFGTNWAEYSRFVGDIFGAPLAVEAVFAFFLESTFLGLYLFGRGKVSRGVHWFSILMVAVGSTLSAFWIIVANSWQQTPAGYVLQNNRAELESFTAAVFNASTFPRFAHTMVACITSGAFFMLGISAYLMIKDASGSSGALVLGKMDGCSAIKADSKATHYSGFALTPDQKNAVYYGDGAIRIATLDGSATAQLAGQGKILLMAGSWLYYSGYATSPAGSISAAVAVPLAGGNAVPVDHSMVPHWKGSTDLMYISSGLKYLDQP